MPRAEPPWTARAQLPRLVQRRKDSFAVPVRGQSVIPRPYLHELGDLGDRFENVTVAIGHGKVYLRHKSIPA